MKKSNQIISLAILLTTCITIKSSDGYNRYQAYVEEMQRKSAIAEERVNKLNKSNSLHKESPELASHSELRKFIVKNHNQNLESCFKKDKSSLRQWLGIEPTTYNKESNVFRMINAIRAKKIIEAHDLNLLDVPQKCLVRDKALFASSTRGIPWGYHNTWTVIAQNIKGYNVRDITLSEAQQMAQFVEKTGYQDFGGHDMNIKRDRTTNKIVFIDLEKASFSSPYVDTQLKLISNLIAYTSSAMTPDALSWLKQYSEKIKKAEPNTPIKRIYSNQQYDDLDIDLTKVASQFKEVEG